MTGDFFIGSRGWDLSAWQESFYPADLPPEWRLSYYANEFNAVLLPVDVWGHADRERLESWVEDVPDAFRFFLELPGKGREVSAGQIQAVVDGLGDACGGLLLLGVQPGEGRLPADALLHCYSKLDGEVQPGVTGFYCLAAAVGQSKPDIFLLEDNPHMDLPAIRQLIMGMASPGAAPYSQALFFSGDAHPASKLQQMRIMVELMGIA